MNLQRVVVEYDSKLVKDALDAATIDRSSFGECILSAHRVLDNNVWIKVNFVSRMECFENPSTWSCLHRLLMVFSMFLAFIANKSTF